MADPEVVAPPPPPPKSASPPRILVIGAGSRGQTYARAVVSSSNGVMVAVAEPDRFRRELLGRQTIWGDGGVPRPGAQFEHWRDFVTYEKQRRERVAARPGGAVRQGRHGENGDDDDDDDGDEGVDAAFVCVQDEMHREVVVALADLGGIHIMCEKPLATRIDDCIDMYRSLRAAGGLVFAVGHVMRYSPHNMDLRRLLLQDRVIGDVLGVVHTEPVGWWHFTHSYVRGNWRREDTSAPSLLTKSCHDIDLLLWLLCSPPSGSEGGVCLDPKADQPHLPSTVSSSGSLQFFKRSRKPVAAGAATNCLSCPAEPSCKYSAKRIYVAGGGLRNLESSNRSWPVNVVLPDIESYQTKDSARAALLAKLEEDYAPGTPDDEVRRRNWFGRCVFESDNDVCDQQVVTMTWDDEDEGGGDSDDARGGSRRRRRGAKTATFHMVAQTKKVCQRFTHIYGVDGEIYADARTITVEDFAAGTTTVHTPRLESVGHGGGDNGITRQFVLAVDRVKNHGWDAARAQQEMLGCTIDDVLRSHAMAFCAEDARRGKKVVDWARWWEQHVEGKLRLPC